VDDALSAVQPAASWVAATLVEAGVAEKLRQDIDVCVEEALANVILHARTAHGAKAIEIELECDAQSVVLVVRDNCTPFDPVSVAVPSRLAGDQVGGAGIKLMRALSHKFAYAREAGLNALSLTFAMRSHDAAMLAIAATPALGGLPEPTRAAIAAAATPADFVGGELLVRQGDESDFAYVVWAGEIEVLSGADESGASLARISAPVLVGEIGALAGVTRTASIRARSAVRAERLPRDALVIAGRAEPELLIGVIAQLGQQIHTVNRALGLYAAGFAALERDDLNESLRAALTRPLPELANFGDAFARLAHRVGQERSVRIDMANAALIQRAMLPQSATIAQLSQHCDLFGELRPAREVGGDMFDVFALSAESLAMLVGDVCGKGVTASLFMSVALTAIRMAAQSTDTLSEAVALANDAICAHNDAAMFTTMFVAELDHATGVLRYVNCGHNPPVRVTEDGDVAPLVGRGPPLGLFPGRVWDVHETILACGEAIVLYSDGVTEAMDQQDNEYGDDRLRGLLARSAPLDARALVRAVFDDVAAFTAGAEPSDDITCLVVRRRD